MKSTVPFTTILLFIRTASGSLQCPFPLKEKEQAEVGQSPTFAPTLLLRGYEAFSGNALSNYGQLNGRKTNSVCNSKAN